MSSHAKRPWQGAPTIFGFLVGTALVATLGYLFWLTLRVPFVLDDHSKILLNPDLRSWDGLWSKLFHRYENLGLGLRNDPSRPLVYLIFTALYQIWGPTPGPFHVVNGLLHGINGIWVMVLSGRLLRGAGFGIRIANVVAFCVASLFLLTPINTGTVAYVYGLSDVLSFFWTGLYLLVGTRGGSLDWRRQGLSIMILILALLTKQAAVMMPLLLVLWDGVRGDWPEWRLKAWAPVYGPAFMVSALYLLWRQLYLGGLGDLEGGSYVKPWVLYELAQPQALAHYVLGTFVPWGLCLDHAPEIRRDLWPLYLGQLAMLVGVLGLVLWTLWRCRRHRVTSVVAFGLFFCGLWLVPTSSFLPTVDYIVERRVYGGTFGLALAVATILASLVTAALDRLDRVWTSVGRAGAILVALAYLGLLTHLSIERLHRMSDEKGLWLETLERYPQSYRALGNLANVYMVAKEFAAAEIHYKKILEIMPRHASTWNNLALIYASPHSPLRNLGEAQAALRHSLEIEPREPEAWHNLGLVTMELGQEALGVAYFKKAIEVDPRHVGSYNQLCALALDRGDWAEARRLLEVAQKIDPRHAMVLENAARLRSVLK